MTGMLWLMKKKSAGKVAAMFNDANHVWEVGIPQLLHWTNNMTKIFWSFIFTELTVIDLMMYYKQIYVLYI